MVLILALLGIIRRNQRSDFNRCYRITTLNLGSTRVGTVVISTGTYLIIVAIVVLIETMGTVTIPKQQDDQH